MKKLPAILLALLLLTACSSPAAGPEASEEPILTPPVEESSLAAEELPEPEPKPEEEAPASRPEEQPAAQSSSSEAPPAESSADQPQPEEPEPEEVPVPSAPGFVRPDYLGVGAPALKGQAEYLGAVEGQVLQGINAQREAVGAAPVQWDANLADAARIRAAELYHNEYVAHQRPNGDSWTTVLTADVPVDYASAGEILAAIATQTNQSKIEDPGYWVTQWVNSEGHYKCMTTPGYTHAGTAVVFAYNEETGLYHGYACTLFAAW